MTNLPGNQGDLVEREPLDELAARVRRNLRSTARDIISIGTDLLLPKELLPYGQFGPWLEREFRLSERTAQRFIAVAARFGAKPDTVAGLEPTTLYELAASSTPDDVVERVVRGELPATVSAIRAARSERRSIDERDGATVRAARALVRATQVVDTLDSEVTADLLWRAYGEEASGLTEALVNHLRDVTDVLAVWVAEEQAPLETSSWLTRFGALLQTQSERNR